MGAGIFGLSIAWVCARRGAAVRVIDPRGPGGGASGGIVGALAPHTPDNWNTKKAFQFESLMMAEPFWAEVEETGGLRSGYGRTGRLQPIADERGVQLAQDRVAAAAANWQGLAEWQIRPVSDFGDWSPPSPTGLLIEDTLSARIDPRRSCEALAAALRAIGVQLVEDGDRDGRIIWATGYEGLLALSENLGRAVGNGVKGQAALLAFDAPTAPQIFAEGLHVVPHDNGTVAIGSTSERDFASPDTTDDQLDTLIARATAIVPALSGAEILARWAGVRPRAKSRAPMLGAWPGREGEYIANGGFKIGFGMAPKVAEVMADLVLERLDAIPHDFRVEANL